MINKSKSSTQDNNVDNSPIIIIKATESIGKKTSEDDSEELSSSKNDEPNASDLEITKSKSEST